MKSSSKMAERPISDIRSHARSKFIMKLAEIGFTENVIAAIYFLFCIAGDDGYSRYAIYIVPVFLFIITLTAGGSLKKSAVNLYIVMLLSLCWPAYNGQPGSASLLFFFVYGLSIVVLNFPVRTILFNKIMYSTIIANVVYSIKVGGISAYYLISSDLERPYESHTFPFIYGLLFGFFFLLREYKFATICFVGLLAGGKRMPIGAAIFGIIVVVAVRTLLTTTNNRRINIISNSIYLRILFVFLFGIFTLNIQQVFDIIEPYIGISLGEFTSGRSNGQVFAYDRLREMPLFHLLFGDGLGTADLLAREAWDIQGVLIHCDYLRLVLDLGMISSLIYILSYLKLVAFGSIGIYISVFIAISLITDNVLLYTYFHITTALIGMWARANHGAES